MRRVPLAAIRIPTSYWHGSALLDFSLFGLKKQGKGNFQAICQVDRWGYLDCYVESAWPYMHETSPAGRIQDPHLILAWQRTIRFWSVWP